jgi:hypothetical protein
MLQCTGLNREGRDAIIWGECDTEISGFDDDFSGLLGIANGIFRDAFIDVRHRPDHDIFADSNVVTYDAAIRADIHIIANQHTCAADILFDTDRGVLPDPDIFPYNAIGVNHNARQVRQPDPFANLRAQHNFDAVLFDE